MVLICVLPRNYTRQAKKNLADVVTQSCLLGVRLAPHLLCIIRARRETLGGLSKQCPLQTMMQTKFE